MQIFLVGGAVRDHIFGQQIKDRDFVVVGATEQEMLDLGFNKVGADFPVFLHPVTGEEFALARRERKVAPGYNGFEVEFDPTVSLEEDLVRRDLTMNAMAVPVNDNLEPNWNEIIDPFGGRADLDAGIIRHVSEAFSEDPVRVLRVARFTARYGFSIALSTVKLMSDLVEAGELDHLVPERVWSEMERALTEPWPMAFFVTLRGCRANQVLFPELQLGGFLESSLRDSPPDAELRFALTCLRLDTNVVDHLCDRLKAPNNFRRLSHHSNAMCTLLRGELNPERLVDVLDSVKGGTDRALEVAHNSAFNTPEFRTRLVKVSQLAPHVQGVRFADLTTDQQQTLKGPAVGAALRELRLTVASSILSQLVEREEPKPPTKDELVRNIIHG